MGRGPESVKIIFGSPYGDEKGNGNGTRVSVCPT